MFGLRGSPAIAGVALAHPLLGNAISTLATHDVLAATEGTTETNDAHSDLTRLLKVEDAAEAIAEGEKTGSAATASAREAVAPWPSVRTSLNQNGATASELATASTAIASLRSELGSRAPISRAMQTRSRGLWRLSSRARATRYRLRCIPWTIWDAP